MNKAKEEQARLKAEEYKKKMEAAKAAQGGASVENDKAAAKRAAKAAKKAAKAAKKGAAGKKSSGLSLGAGTSFFLKLLLDGSDFAKQIDPSKDGQSTGRLLRELLDRIGSGGVMRVLRLLKVLEILNHNKWLYGKKRLRSFVEFSKAWSRRN